MREKTKDQHTMERKIEKDSIEFQLFQEWWNFRQKYYEPRTEQDFEELVDAGNKFVVYFSGTGVEKLARSLVLTHTEDCEIRFKTRKTNQKKTNY